MPVSASTSVAGCGALLLALTWQAARAEMPSPASAKDLTVVSWGGQLTRSQMRAFVEPYREQGKAWVEMDTYAGGIDKIRAQVQAENVLWDVIDIGPVDLAHACDEGLLEPLDPSFMQPAPDGTPPADDFVEGSLHECAVGHMIWATVVMFDRADFPDGGPSTIEHFFDPVAYPGGRSIRRDPRVNLEWALIASGVPQDEVYATLETEDGLQRAFAMLDRIRPNIVWWTDGEEPIDFLDQDRVSMAQIWNGRSYRPLIEDQSDYGLIWDNQIWDFDYWAVIKGSGHLDDALDFLAFTTASERQAKQMEFIPYGPPRRSAMERVSERMRPLLPTAEANMKTALKADSLWWAEHYVQLSEAFEDWIRRSGESALAGVPR